MAPRPDRTVLGPCLCGCGEPVPYVDRKGRQRVGCARGHYPRPGRRRATSEASLTTRYRRSRARCDAPAVCEWAFLGHCLGPLDVAHVNGDTTDDRAENLKRLCHSHHFLLDNGRIDPADPRQPAYTVSSGKRRYT